MNVAVIESLSLTAALLAFVGGLVSFVSPCVLPLLPAYLSFISGVAVDDLQARRVKVLRVALAFVAGFTVVFMLLGAGAGGIGRLLVDYRHELTIVAGVFLGLSGLVVAGLIRVPERAVTFSPRAGGLGGAFVTGAAVSIGWTPCAGYILGAILTLAGSGHGAWQGAVLLFVYSAGLAVPFLVAALAFDRAAARLAAVKRHYRAVQVVSGAILVVFGVLVATGLAGRLSALLPSIDLGL